MTWRATSAPFVRGLALGAALAGACASRGPAPPTAPAAPPAAATDGADVSPPVPANAGAIFVFHPAGGISEWPSLPEAEAAISRFSDMCGVDLRYTFARLGGDPERPVVASWAIVEPTQLRRLLDSPEPPPDDAPLAIRFHLVIPVVDPVRSAATLVQSPPERRCASVAGDATRWSVLLRQFKRPDDRRAAEDRTAAYVCRDNSPGRLRDGGGIGPGFWASITRVDRSRREVTCTAAFGHGSLLAAAAMPLALDGVLAGRLRRAGLFTARVGVYTTPTDEASAYKAIQLVTMRAGLPPLDEGDERARMWREGLLAVGAVDRLVASPPSLFADMLIADRQSSWTLTPDGRAFFSSLGLPPNANAGGLLHAIVERMKPVGPFADPVALGAAVDEVGSGATILMGQFLWPHTAASWAAHPGSRRQLFFEWADDTGRVELDQQAGFLRVHTRRRR